ncbi:hypothetical protein ABT364_13675 [Massilia sp. SR12]
MIATTGQFTLTELADKFSSGEYSRRLSMAGIGEVGVVKGEQIVAQFECQGLFLVVTCYDYFDGVSHWYYVVDGSGVIVDSASTPDYFGFLERLEVEEANRISFGFFGTNDRWSLELHVQGLWSYRFEHLARRINRHMLRKRYMSLVLCENL